MYIKLNQSQWLDLLAELRKSTSLFLASFISCVEVCK